MTMTTDNQHFPLLNKIKGILDNPDTRPKLPGDSSFGKPENYDPGTQPSVALNDDNVVVEVHQGDWRIFTKNDLAYRAGRVNGKNQIDWQPVNAEGELGAKYDTGNNPSVAVNNQGLVVEVHETGTGEIWYHIAQLKPDKPNNWVEFQSGIYYDKGYSPSVAINDNEIVVEVHQSEGLKTDLWYRTGRVNGQKIDWQPVNDSGDQSGKYDKGNNPSVAINNFGRVVEVHETGTGEIWYHIAQLKPDKPNNWVEFQPGIYYDKGYSPSVAINDNETVVVIHNSDDSTLVYRTGQVNTDSNKIDWSEPQSIKYDGKKLSRPKVACNTTLAVETHEDGAGLSYSILPLPSHQWIFNNWMSNLPDNLKISRLTIPGTHDTCTYTLSSDPLDIPSVITKCQDRTLEDQLSSGIRFIDIRCRHINNEFAIHHGQVYLNLNFDKVRDVCIDFLKRNPSECIVMSVKHEYDDGEGITRSYEATFDSYLQGSQEFWYFGDTIPRLGDVRGKIVLFRRFNLDNRPNRTETKGIDASSWPDNATFDISVNGGTLKIQDEYKVSNLLEEIERKWNKIKNLIDQAKFDAADDWYVNFTNGANFADSTFPWIHGITPNVVAGRINYRVYDYIDSSKFPNRLGTFVMDFPDDNMISRLINLNK
ncbi:MAG TPA: hypothetical protein DCL61_17955 [Cyanobacteria bacterium UBA12227]|nr:hypothetical protein [Cyanobacteria bacterium UBA12227]HAX87077.1 hypothetical protein [Cyanobacteria bacterium UBA11370]HBY78719.1 hypothetical protein [Cyanobacteria bacterium UBA11148]